MHFKTSTRPGTSLEYVRARCLGAGLIPANSAFAYQPTCKLTTRDSISANQNKEPGRGVLYYYISVNQFDYFIKDASKV